MEPQPSPFVVHNQLRSLVVLGVSPLLIAPLLNHMRQMYCGVQDGQGV